jgi:trimeric autotransporter adhesin
MSAELGVAASNAQRSASALQESLASGHLSTQKLSDYQKRVQDIANSDAPARAIVSAVGAPFLLKGIHNNIARVGDALNRKVAQGQEALEQAGQDLQDRLAQLPQGMRRVFQDTAGRLAGADPQALAAQGLERIGIDAPARAVSQLAARAGEDAETAARVAAGRAAGAFDAAGNYAAQGQDAVEAAASAATRGIAAGAELPEEVQGIANVARVAAGRAPLSSITSSVLARAKALNESLQAQLAGEEAVAPTATSEEGAAALSQVAGDAAGPALSGPATELASSITGLTRGAAGFQALGDALTPSINFGATAGPLAAAVQSGRSAAAAAAAAPEEAAATLGVPGSTSLASSIGDATATARGLLNSDMAGTMQSGIEAGRELGANVDSGARALASAASGAVDDATDAGAQAVGSAVAQAGKAAGSAANEAATTAAAGADAAVDAAAAGTETAAAAEGGLNPIADISALALGLASVLGPALAPKPTVTPPKPPAPIGTAAGVGV